MNVKSFLLCFLLAGLFSCSDSEDKVVADLIGEWQLKEVLADPGDGSGRFFPVESDKVVQFYVNGEVRSNRSLCGHPLDKTDPVNGIYSFTDSTIVVKNCNSDRPQIELPFSIEGNYLTIHYFCIEGCAERYVKK